MQYIPSLPYIRPILNSVLEFAADAFGTVRWPLTIYPRWKLSWDIDYGFFSGDESFFVDVVEGPAHKGNTKWKFFISEPALLLKSFNGIGCDITITCSKIAVFR